MRTRLFCQAVLSLSLVFFLSAGAAAKKPQVNKVAPQAPRPTVQLAVLLDTSNSMDGLIDQAKTQLWTIVNEFAKTKLAGQLPQLEVALYEYGNSNLSATKGYIRMVSPLTSDLDAISEKLFALKTKGGDEYCGMVLQAALQQLKWSKAGGLRCIFIAGNEPFSQGDVDYRLACKAAADKGVTVSTIYCGDRQKGIQTGWQDGARRAEGAYLCINQDHKSRGVKTPQDAEIVRLGSQLNKTYVPYGDAKTRAAFADRQKTQDANAAKSTVSAAASRAGFKASGLYRNAGWDLIDALAAGRLKLQDVDNANLPENMRAMSIEQRREYLANLAKQRKEISKRIAALTARREAFIAQERARLAAESPAAAKAAAEPFADAVKEAIDAQQKP